MLESDRSDGEKGPAAEHFESGAAATTQHHSRHDEIRRIDAITTSPEITMESFKHIDEKKVLRKVSSSVKWLR